MSAEHNSSACEYRPLEENELIHVDCLKHVYPDGTSSLHNVCFSLYKREIVAICGANGAGKSTLIEHLNGLLKPSIGRLVVLQEEVTPKTGIITAVGLVFQDADSQLFAPTVLDDVMFGPLNKGQDIEDARRTALSALERIGALHLVQRIPYYLSKGEKRLVAIAGVLAMGPEVIVADEPTSDLDPVHARRIESLLLDLKNQSDISVVITTHDMDLAARLADRIYVIADGHIVATGSPSDIFYNKDVLEAAGLEQPTAVRIYERLRKSYALAEGRPTKERDLMAILAQALGELSSDNVDIT